MKRALMIINPVAGKLRARNALFGILDAFCRGGYLVTTAISLYRGHARELAMAATPEEYDKIVCIGGDGTLNEVIGGVYAGGRNIPLAYIPAGSTNDFAASMRLPRGIEEATRVAIHGTATPIDIGIFCENRTFAYVASFGAFTSASYSAPQATKNALGHFAYLLEGVKDLVSLQAYPVRAQANGTIYEGDYVFGAVANSTSVGGIVKLNSSLVDMNDGLFEVLLVRRPRTAGDVNAIVSAVLNSNLNNHMCDFFSAGEVCFEMPEPMSWSLDGEQAGADRRVTVKNLYGAVNIVH